jgi:hypothetical protein
LIRQIIPDARQFSNDPTYVVGIVAIVVVLTVIWRQYQQRCDSAARERGWGKRSAFVEKMEQQMEERKGTDEWKQVEELARKEVEAITLEHRQAGKDKRGAPTSGPGAELPRYRPTGRNPPRSMGGG